TGSNAHACKRHIAPGAFDNPAAAWNGSDSGVVIDGFADLLDSKGQKFAVAHGIDLSSHNVVDYKKIKECGGEFSFLRIDERFGTHWEQLRAEGIVVIPYYFFPIPQELRQGELYEAPIESAIKQSLGTFEAIGKTAAEAFKASLNSLLPEGLAPSRV